MIWLITYFVFLSVTAISYFIKGWHNLNHESLTSQKLFWAAILIPLISFVYFGVFAWAGHSVEMSSVGLNKFIEISKLPLGLLSLSIPFVAIITGLHRSIQTAAQISSANIQIELAKRKNSIDELFSREKNFVDKCAYIEKQVGEIDINLKSKITKFKFSLSAPHILFHKIYDTTQSDNGTTYELTGFMTSSFLVELLMIEENISLHYECIENNERNSIDDELSRLFVIVRALSQIFDLLTVPTCELPYFMINGKDTKYQIFMSSENELKSWLRKIIILAESLFNVANIPNENSLMFVKKDVFQGHELFPSFNDGNILANNFVISWDKAVNTFKN